MTYVEGQERLVRLAQAAEDIVDLPMQQQFTILHRLGLRLGEDTNWENCNTDKLGLVYVIPTRSPEPSSTKPEA